MARIFSALLLTMFGLAGVGQAATLTFDSYYHNDHLGSPVATTDERGDLLWRAHFRPYGERQESPTDAAFGNVGYTGHTQDADSGLVYMQARYYDPVIGRFMAVDPAEVNPESAISFNRYAYANNNPMRFFDPDGRMSKELPKGGRWSPGFETNIFTGGGGWGPITGVKRGLTPQGELVNSGAIKGQGVAKNAPTSRAARREAMRDAGIPTSQQPVSQSRNTSGREYSYDVPASGGGTQRMSVQQQTMDRSHQGQPHWEAGRVKTDPLTGVVRENNYGRPALTNEKSKVNY